VTIHIFLYNAFVQVGTLILGRRVNIKSGRLICVI
jgi:hypothetical protein